MYDASGKPHILIADTEEGDARISAVLRGYRRQFVRTLDEAKELLQTRAFNLAVIGARFDGGRMRHLLEWLRSNERIMLTPVACIAHASTGLAPVRSAAAAAAAGRADVFIDLHELPLSDAADRRLRRMLDDLMERRQVGARALISRP